EPIRPDPGNGRVAQRKSTSLTWRGSQVRSLSRPPSIPVSRPRQMLLRTQASLRAEQENLVVPRPRPRSTSRARAGWARGQTRHEPPQSVTAVFYIDELISGIYNNWSRSLIGAVAKSGSGEASLAIR